MKLTRIDITSFLRISRMKIELGEQRVHLFAGHNEAGKTSLQEAIRFCLLGETARVKRKSDYKLMITDGAKDGEVRLVVNGDELVRDVATGKGTADGFIAPLGLDTVLDATRYTWMDDKARRTFLFKLLNVSVKPAVIRERLLDKKVPDRMVDEILPMLRAGFEAACSMAKAKATEARGEWKGITNEVYGPKKAAEWAPPKQNVTPELEAEQRRKLEELENAHHAAIQHQAEHRSTPGGIFFPCPACGVELVYNRGDVTESQGRRQSAEATAEDSVRLAKLTENVSKAKAALDEQRDIIAALDRQILFNTQSDQVKARADAAHQQVVDWVTLAEALAPDGIPSQIIAERLKPVNDRLRETATMTGWPQVAIKTDMDIVVENRPYGLQSESSQWRTQAAIAEAISAISGLGLFVLDRIDVLDLPNRTNLLKWIMKVAKDHNTILLIGTLKEPPKLPGVIKSYWLEKGQISQ